MRGIYIADPTQPGDDPGGAPLSPIYRFPGLTAWGVADDADGQGPGFSLTDRKTGETYVPCQPTFNDGLASPIVSVVGGKRALEPRNTGIQIARQLLTGSAYTWFMVGQFDLSIGYNQGIIGDLNSAAGPRAFVATDGSLRIGHDHSPTVVSTVGSIVTNTPVLLMAAWNGAEITYAFDGADQTPVAYSTAIGDSDDVTVIGAQDQTLAASMIDGYIWEWLVFDRDLTETSNAAYLNRLTALLMAKYGL